MSRLLKFIVHFIVICTVLCVVALVAPPFWGITTVIVDNVEKETNLPLGSVTYAIPVDTESVGTGTSILVENGGQTYRYNIESLDLENKTGMVVDPSDPNSESIPVQVKNKVPKVVVTIGLLGYLFVATESIEGLIILGLAVLFLVILYVIAELWKKEPAEDDLSDEEEEDDTYIKSKKELKREEKERARRMKEEDKQMLKEEKKRRKQEKKERKVIHTGGFVDEVYEEDFPDGEEETPPGEAQAAATEAHELLKKEIAATTQDEEPVQEPEAEEEVSVPVQEEVVEEEPIQPEPAEIKKMAIPLWSAAQLADKAKQEGDAPDIVKDGITNVTLFDYSDIISGEEATETEP